MYFSPFFRYVFLKYWESFKKKWISHSKIYQNLLCYSSFSHRSRSIPYHSVLDHCRSVPNRSRSIFRSLHYSVKGPIKFQDVPNLIVVNEFNVDKVHYYGFIKTAIHDGNWTIFIAIYVQLKMDLERKLERKRKLERHGNGSGTKELQL